MAFKIHNTKYQTAGMWISMEVVTTPWSTQDNWDYVSWMKNIKNRLKEYSIVGINSEQREYTFLAYRCTFEFNSHTHCLRDIQGWI